MDLPTKDLEAKLADLKRELESAAGGMALRGLRDKTAVAAMSSSTSDADGDLADAMSPDGPKSDPEREAQKILADRALKTAIYAFLSTPELTFSLAQIAKGEIDLSGKAQEIAGKLGNLPDVFKIGKGLTEWSRQAQKTFRVNPAASEKSAAARANKSMEAAKEAIFNVWEEGSPELITAIEKLISDYFVTELNEYIYLATDALEVQDKLLADGTDAAQDLALLLLSEDSAGQLADPTLMAQAYGRYVRRTPVKSIQHGDTLPVFKHLDFERLEPALQAIIDSFYVDRATNKVTGAFRTASINTDHVLAGDFKITFNALTNSLYEAICSIPAQVSYHELSRQDVAGVVRKLFDKKIGRVREIDGAPTAQVNLAVDLLEKWKSHFIGALSDPNYHHADLSLTLSVTHMSLKKVSGEDLARAEEEEKARKATTQERDMLRVRGNVAGQVTNARAVVRFSLTAAAFLACGAALGWGGRQMLKGHSSTDAGSAPISAVDGGQSVEPTETTPNVIATATATAAVTATTPSLNDAGDDLNPRMVADKVKQEILAGLQEHSLSPEKTHALNALLTDIIGMIIEDGIPDETGKKSNPGASREAVKASLLAELSRWVGSIKEASNSSTDADGGSGGFNLSKSAYSQAGTDEVNVLHQVVLALAQKLE